MVGDAKELVGGLGIVMIASLGAWPPVWNHYRLTLLPFAVGHPIGVVALLAEWVMLGSLSWDAFRYLKVVSTIGVALSWLLTRQKDWGCGMDGHREIFGEGGEIRHLGR